MSVSRRTLIAAASAAPLAAWAGTASTKSGRKSLIKPKALKDGSTVALVSPSSAINGQADIEKAKRNMEALGFKTKPGPHATENWGYLAGTDEHRADDINAAFKDPEVDGVICVQGGYGAARLLDRLDFGAIRANPKVILGYSDITALLLSIYARSGLVTFHGPIALSEFDDYGNSNFTKAAKTAQPIGLLAEPQNPGGDPPKPSAATLFPGKATGPIVGGNLSLVASLVGSPYLPSFDGHILFLEDVSEEPYRIDRMLNTLRTSGNVKGVRGIVFGDFTPRAEQPGSPPPDPARSFTMQQVLQNFADQTRVPTYCGAWFGHIREKYTLPLGIRATLDADAHTLSIIEAAVS